MNVIDTPRNSNIANTADKKIIKNMIALPITTIIKTSLLLRSSPYKLNIVDVKPPYKNHDSSIYYRLISLFIYKIKDDNNP